ncbi:hypothetical protein PIB30_102592, partial [Stylosanthes scabra]|nr:hypothetical protein [Stylosanthes scabra]
MSRLTFTTHLAKRDIHGLKASLGKLAQEKVTFGPCPLTWPNVTHQSSPQASPIKGQVTFSNMALLAKHDSQDLSQASQAQAPHKA